MPRNLIKMVDLIEVIFGLFDLQFALSHSGVCPREKKSSGNLTVALTLKTARVSLSCPAIFPKIIGTDSVRSTVGDYRTTDHC